eukprot:5479511-Amphidinium_carterae.1
MIYDARHSGLLSQRSPDRTSLPPLRSEVSITIRLEALPKGLLLTNMKNSIDLDVHWLQGDVSQGLIEGLLEVSPVDTCWDAAHGLMIPTLYLTTKFICGRHVGFGVQLPEARHLSSIVKVSSLPSPGVYPDECASLLPVSAQAL